MSLAEVFVVVLTYKCLNITLKDTKKQQITGNQTNVFAAFLKT